MGLNLRDARRIAVAGGEVQRLAGQGFVWERPEPGGGGGPGPEPSGEFWAWADGAPIAWENGDPIALVSG